MNRALRESAALPLLVFVLMSACAAGWSPGPRGVAAAGDTAPRRARQEKKKTEPTAEVYGRAVYEGTGRPVRRARVLLMNVDGGGLSPGGLTDGQGEFRIRGVAAGRYAAIVDLPGLVSPFAFFGTAYMRKGPPYELDPILKNFDVFEVDGQAAREVKVTARRGAALGGKVTYADGSPAVGAQIYVMRRTDGRLERVMTGFYKASAAGGLTDDRGVFRAAGLPPGEYFVAVAETATHGEGESSHAAEYDSEQLTVSGVLSLPLLMTFHPSASGAADATALKLGAGDEHEDVNIVIAERELRELSGSVRARRDGRPLVGARVAIYRKGEEDGFADSEYTHYGTTRPNVTKTDEHGRWRLKDIPDGPYTIYVKPSDEHEVGPAATGGEAGASPNRNSNMSYTPRRPKRRFAPTRRDVQVAADTGELTFELGEGGRISGTVVVEGGKSSVTNSFVYIVREVGGGEHDFRNSSVTEGEFSFEGLPPGQYSVHYQSYMYEHEQARGYARSMTWEGKDLLRERLTVGEGASVEGVRVLVSTDVATLRVSVKAGSRAARDVPVFLLPVGPDGWTPHAQQYYCATGADGSCGISAAPGEYAVVMLPPSISSTEEWVAEMKRRGTTAPRAVLRAGETRTLKLAQPEPR